MEKTILAMFNSGKTVREIAEATDMDMEKVKYLVYVKAGLRRKEIQFEQVKEQIGDKLDRVLHLYKWGYTPCEIKEDVNVPVELIQELIRNSDVKRKAPSYR
jgi:hypothetical protein